MTSSNLKPLDTIGLCFSGGGYRAAAFALGVLAYLHRLTFKGQPLLQRVEALSTVSGGTITGAFYAYSQSQKWSFEQFYEQLYAFLNDDKLLNKALELLESDEVWTTQEKKRTLSNAFAMAYIQLLCAGTMGDLAKNAGALRDVCFNATDFAFGLAFRFQASGVFGNHRLKNAALNKLVGKVRIADAIASSSCFPVGFDPMIFPDDYFDDHSSEQYKELKQKEFFRDGIGIMDGGIVDNQGIGSMVNIDKRREGKGEALSAIIVCDVGSFKMEPWQPDNGAGNEQAKSKTLEGITNSLLRFFQFRWYHWVFLLLGILVTGLNSMRVFGGSAWPFLYVAGGVLAGAGGFLFVVGLLADTGRRIGVSFVKKLYKSKIPEALIDDVVVFQKLDIGLVKRMIKERLSSAFVMINEIFLNQIRRLNYNLFFESERLKGRRIGAYIYQLCEDVNSMGPAFDDKKPKPPTPLLKESARIAAEMPTTLWFDEKDRTVNRLENLVACGQFTICYNLLDYVLRLPDEARDEDLKLLEASLKKDWNNFLKDPYFMKHPIQAPQPAST